MRRSHPPRALAGVLVFLAVILLAGFQAAQADATTTIFLVRHAEKAVTPGDDPALDSVGEVRARALAAALRDARIQKVLVTQYRRTALTAAPLAQTLGVTPTVIDTRAGGAAHVKAVADAARVARGEAVLVVGHSNTIPLIVRELGGTAEPMADADYDDLYIVILPATGTPRTVHARYGAPHSSR